VEKAQENFQAIRTFLGKRYGSRFIPVIPISAQRKINLEYVCQYLGNLPLPERKLNSPPLMRVIRSFDINKPGADIDELVGGVAGGSISQGILKIDQKVEIRHGIIYMKNGIKTCRPIVSKIISMTSETTALKLAGPGGLIAVQTTIDPSLTKSDRLVGQLLGIPGQLPDVYEQIIITYSIMNRVVGVNTTTDKDGSKSKTSRILNVDEVLKLNIGSATTAATVKKVDNNIAMLSLYYPSCCSEGEKISISRKIGDNNWRLVGFGKIEKDSVPLTLQY